MGKYCSHSLVVHGKLKAFVSCPSSDLLMHYNSLSPDSALNVKTLQFTQRVAENGGKDFTGHLSFDFLVESQHKDEKEKENIKLYPTECNPRAHTAVVLFQYTPEMANAYLSCFDPDSD
ncbi:hypothetical protein BJX99DRAFT_263501 [Aspergillus californicus]